MYVWVCGVYSIYICLMVSLIYNPDIYLLDEVLDDLTWKYGCYVYVCVIDNISDIYI
jgi:hypothetical protein